MTTHWPPTPSVEDEDAALAREFNLSSATSSSHSNEEAQLKGSVDQYPIIVDALPIRPSRNNSSAIELDREQSSSDESHGPPTPVTNNEQRFVLLDHETPKKVSPAAGRNSSGPKLTQNLKSEDVPRGRPYVAPIQTNVGDDLTEAISGRRRPPSPYSSGPKQSLTNSKSDKRFSGESFLSPQYASADESCRVKPSNPRMVLDDGKYMTDPDRPSEKRRQHSRRRRESGIRTARSSVEQLPPLSFAKRSMSYVAAVPIAGSYAAGRERKLEDETTERQKRSSRESPPSSSVEDRPRRQRSKSRRRSKSRSDKDRQAVRDSPYTSSAEEAGARGQHSKRTPPSDGKLSRRGSTIRKDRTGLNISEQYFSYGVGDIPPEKVESTKHRPEPHKHPVLDRPSFLEPSSAQSPQAMEDYLAKALKGDSKRSSYTPRGSPHASPFTTPPRSPIGTPRGNRSSKDYFDLVSPVFSESPRSRQHSGEESPWNILRPLANANFVVGTGMSKPAPPLSRSSTGPIDTASQSSSSKAPSSGQRSRRPSSVQEDPIRPVARASTLDVRDDRPILRAPTSTINEQRRPQRISTLVTEASSSAEHSLSSRSGYVGLEAPQATTRAYSTTAEEMARPSSSHRALSSSQVFPSQTTEKFRPPPGQRALSSNYVSATSSSTPGPSFSTIKPAFVSPVTVEGGPVPVTNFPPTPTNLPPCPRSKAVSGLHDWYTVSQVTEIDICPSCMTTLGSSRFRDIFLHSLPKPGKEIRCAMSQPWLRIAFIQAVKQRRSPLDMTKLLYDLLHLPENTIPCPGKRFETRKWYQLIDPFDDSIVPGFEICTHCVRNTDLVFPQLTGTFKRTTTLPQERGCNLNTQSKRFLGYIEQLDKAATRFDNENLRRPDIQDLAKYARRVANIRDCPRDNMTFGGEWHFITRLPEFTVCGECYEEVIRPVYEKPIARDLCKKPKLLPISSSRSQYVVPAATSCQLYSSRMRRVFQDAVKLNDYELLRSAAVKRHEAEIGCQTRHRQLNQDMGMGYDRTKEILQNVEVWKSWE